MLTNIHKSAALALFARMACSMQATFDPFENFNEAYLERLAAAIGEPGLVSDNGDSGAGGFGSDGGSGGFGSDGGSGFGFGGGSDGFGGSDFDIDDPDSGNTDVSKLGGGLVGSGQGEVTHPENDTYMGKF